MSHGDLAVTAEKIAMANKRIIGKAVSWSALDVLTRVVLNFIVLILLARLLAPADFGLVAMLAIFVAVAQLLIESGFSQALIQRQQTTPTDESTIFFFTLLMGAAISLALCLAAPAIANFYQQPILQPMTYWMALNLFVNAFGSIHTALLTKELDFKTIAKAGIGASLVSGVVGVYMAVDGWGVWSLVGKTLVGTTSSVLLLWFLHPWRARYVFSLDSLKSYFKFGGFLLWTGLLNTIYTNLYALLIGKLHSVADVGYFSQAQRLQQMPVTIVTNVVGRVAFPVFSAAAADKERLARGLRKSLVSVVFISAPMMMLLLCLAEPLVLVLLGHKWLNSAPVLQALAIVGLLWPIHALNINVLKAQGHSALNARLQLIKLTMAILILVATSPFGIVAIAYGQVGASLLVFFINAHYSKRLLNYNGFAQLRDVAPYLAATLPMVMVVLGGIHYLGISLGWRLPIVIVAGLASYMLVCRMLKLEALDYALVLFSPKK